MLSTTAASDPNVAEYSIASIEYAPTPMVQIGKLQAGLLCLPKGKLRWRDVARPDDEVLAKRLERVLGDAGLSVAQRADPLFADPAPLTRYRVRIVVEQVKLRLCIAGLGIGEKKPSGEGLVVVRWETYDREARAKIDEVNFKIPLLIAGRDARDATGVIGDAIVESVSRYADHRAP